MATIQTCECNAKDMPFAACCKARKSFEAWYDKQPDGRIQPFDVWIAATNQARAEFDALAADAARYRWLTENKHVPWGAMKLPINILLDNGIDAAIDAAMKGE